MKKPTAAKAPSHLTKEAQKWWREIMAEYRIEDPAGLLLLMVAMESFDRMKAAQTAIAEDGQVFQDKAGQPKSHPLIVVERDARSAMLSSLRQLNLDIEPLKDGPGRPVGT